MDRRRLAALLAAAAKPPVVTGPLTRTHLDHAGSGTGILTIGVTVTPVANSLLIVTAGSRRNTALPSAISCVDNAGVGNVYTDTVAQGSGLGTNGVRQAVFKCRMGASPGTFTITVSLVSGTSIALCVEQFENASDDLSNVSPMVYSATGDPACTLPSTPSAANIVLGNFTCTGNFAPTLPAGHTSIANAVPSGAGLTTSAGNVSTAAGVWSSSNADSLGCLLEVKQAA